ncbi:MAG: hypothetical protein GX797_10365 [Chloroflexi bacterium]|nr:hypothetical protein [Chloroflexota bacterium]
MEPTERETIEENQLAIVEFNPEKSGIGLIATKPLDHCPEIELTIENIFSCYDCEEKREICLENLLGSKGNSKYYDKYLKLIEEAGPVVKLNRFSPSIRNFFWHEQYKHHCSDHFYEDLMRSVDGNFAIYFVYFPNVSQEEVNELFKLLKGRTPYYTVNETGRSYNTKGYGIRGLYPRKSTTIQNQLYTEVTNNTISEREIPYYFLKREEQIKVYPYLEGSERYRILSNTVHTPDSLNKISSFINILYADYFDDFIAKSSDDKFLALKLLTLKRLIQNESC